MKIALRLIAVWEFALAALMLLAIALGALLAVLEPSVVRSVVPDSVRGLVVATGVFVVPPLGGYAALHLWRLQRSGLYASMALLVLFGVMGLAQGSSASPGKLLKFAVWATIVALLASPRARATCPEAVRTQNADGGAA